MKTHKNSTSPTITPYISTRASSILMMFVLVASAVLLGGVSVQAGTFNWTNAVPDNYTNPAAWDPNGVPGIADTAVIGNATVADATVLYTNLLSDPLSTNNLSLLQMGAAAGTSTFTMNDGVLLITNGTAGVAGGGAAFQLGNASGAIDTFTQDGGTLVVARPSNSQLYYQDGFLPGHVNGASGTYTINNGLLTILCGCEIAASGSGTFNINGGTVIDNGWFGLRGGGQNTDSGTFNMTGGTLYILRNKGDEGGSGTYGGLAFSQNGYSSTSNISGGTLYCTKIHFGNNANANETLNISGGNLYIGFLGLERQGAAASQTINISGGAFHTADMQEITTTADVGNTNTVLSDGVDWAWDANLPVNLTNSTFLVNGASGPGYVTFAPEATRTITLNNVWSGVGGLNVNGPGTVAMSAANIYTGGTTISQGTLAFNNGGSVLDPALAVSSGATLDFNAGNVTQTFTNNVTGAGDVAVTLGNLGLEIVTGSLGHTGGTMINSGMLEVDGTLNNSSAVIVTNTGALGGSGQVSAPIMVENGGTIFAGTVAAPGTLTAGDVTVNDGGAMNLRITTDTTPGGGINDLLQANNVTLGANSVLNINPLLAPSIGTYVLVHYTGALSGTFGTVNIPNGSAVAYNTGEIDLVVTNNTIENLTWSAPPIGDSYINWDVGTSTNWLNAGVLTTFHQLDKVTFDNPSGTTNRVSVADIVSPSSVTIAGNAPYIFSGVGHISGSAGITYNDTNTSGIYTFGSDFTGPVNINAGVLQLGAGGSSWLGATNGGTIVNGGTLDLNGQSVGDEPLVIQGSGQDGNGAINNFSSSSPNLSGGPLNITLAGDTTINASGHRWDIGINTLGAGGGSFNGNGYTLTKIGTNDIWMHELGDIGVGDININQGQLGFEFNIGLGDPSKAINVAPGAVVGFWQITNASQSVTKQISLNSATLASYGSTADASNVLNGTITLSGMNTFQINRPTDLNGIVAGAGGIQKVGGGTLYVQGTNTYTGPTVINAGSIVLGTNAVLGPSSPIELASNTVLDASAPGGLTLGDGQTLSGSGNVAGDVTAGSGATINPGTAFAASTLTFNNNLTLNGATNVIKLGSDPGTIGGGVNDLIVINGNLTNTGISTIEITPTANLYIGAPYTIMQYNGTLTGGAANLQVVCDNPGYTVSLVDPTTTSGSIQVSVVGNAANLLWKGNAASDPNAWDHSTTNWLNLDTTNPAAYHPGDNTIFDDTASTKTVDVNTVNIGSTTMSNTTDYTFAGGGVLGGTLDMEGSGALTLAVSQQPELSAITANYGTLVFDEPGVVYSNSAAISGGSGTVVKAGTNTLVMSADNSQFYGTILITNGVLQYTTTAGLGLTSAPLYATNNGTLDLHGVTSGPKNINIQGAGFNGQGAVINTGGSLVNQAGINYLNFVGDATIGGTGRWDIYNNTIYGNGFNVTKVGIGGIFFSGDLDTGLGNLDIKAGRIGFQADITMGDPAKTVTIESGAAVTFYGLTNSSSPNGGEDKIAILQGDSDSTNGFAVMDSGGGNNNFNGPVTLVGTNNIFGVRSDLHLWNGVSGSGGFIASGNYYAGSDHFSGNGTLYLEGTNTYTGPTIVSNNVAVGTNSSLGDSSLILISSGKTLDVSAPASFDLGAGQTLMGAGTVIGDNIVFGSGATLAAGFPDANTYTLTMNGNLALQSGSTNIVIVNKAGTVANDTVAGLTSVAMGGTLIVTNIGSPLAFGDAIKLFDATSYSGGFANIIPATPGAGLTWDTSQLDSSGTLLVSAPVNPNPTNIVFSVSGNQLTLNWPADHTGWTLQTQTNNLSVGISTNWVDVANSTTTNQMMIPINLTNGSVFYRLVYTNAP